MRKIKFRAWDKGKERMWYSDTPFSLDRPSWFFTVEIRQSESANYLPKDQILMQFTGLKDKNGKEIYEGDIVKYVGQLYPDRFKIYEIKWDDKLAGFYAGGGQLRRASSYEVIGNVYENSELIK